MKRSQPMKRSPPPKRRTPLARTGGLARKALKRGKRLRTKMPSAKVLKLRGDWREGFESCAACWAYAGWMDVGLELHHILPGASKIERPWNYLILCQTCHTTLTGSNHIPTCCLLKHLADPEHENFAEMAKYKGRAGSSKLKPMATALPEWIWQAREKNGFYRPDSTARRESA